MHSCHKKSTGYQPRRWTLASTRAFCKYMGCEFESHTCHNKNTIREEGSKKSLHKVYYPRRTESPVSSSAALEIEYATQFQKLFGCNSLVVCAVICNFFISLWLVTKNDGMISSFFCGKKC